jgi:hypothetical protein
LGDQQQPAAQRGRQPTRQAHDLRGEIFSNDNRFMLRHTRTLTTTTDNFRAASNVTNQFS